MKSYKKDFPIFSNNKNLIYLDSAATTQKPKVVLDAIQDYYENYNANVRRALYPIAEEATKKVEEVRKKVAKFINARFPEEIIFVKNSTEGINLVMDTWGKANINSEDKIATTIMEHHSNFVPWQYLSNLNENRFEIIDINENGELDKTDLIKKTKDIKFLAITHVSNVLGTVNPIKEIIADVKKRNGKKTKVLIDAAQSVTRMPVDVQNLDCDFLVLSGHKLFAGMGVGIVYGKKELLDQMNPFLLGSDMISEVSLKETTFAHTPQKFEAGTPDVEAIISLGTAIDYIEKIGLETIQKHEAELITYCLSLLSKIEGVTIYGPRDSKKRAGVISFNVKGIHPHDVAQIMGEKNICIRAGHHCTMPLHTRLGLFATARISFSIYNTKEDIDKAINGIKEAKRIFKK